MKLQLLSIMQSKLFPDKFVCFKCSLRLVIYRTSFLIVKFNEQIMNHSLYLIPLNDREIHSPINASVSLSSLGIDWFMTFMSFETLRFQIQYDFSR